MTLEDAIGQARERAQNGDDTKEDRELLQQAGEIEWFEDQKAWMWKAEPELDDPYERDGGRFGEV